ncbi:hypothetical protein LRS74_02395 [Streptomyces sp. LX-29]|uniref:hypothetical protein n=1 Tax=Streptomyces sp. LX-29 TaxID=2900152 RepID=UPI00240D60F1|nr:hypothetical protein [Streptomyces sp. LX-29]WFB06011.1 hypothetical protein LRS74_02395 [Streptomyces sp. LX-29]
MILPPRRRGRAAVVAALFLTFAAAGCSDAGDAAIGTINYQTKHHHGTITNPTTDGCHALHPDGALKVENDTSADILLFTDPGCRQPKGTDVTYLATTLSDNPAPGAGAWHSFSIVK